MKTLLTTAIVVALAASGWVVDTLAGLAPLTLLVAMGLAAAAGYAGVIYATARQADAEAARRRRDLEFARRARVVR